MVNFGRKASGARVPDGEDHRYVTDLPAAKLVENWQSLVNLVLVNTVEHLRQIETIFDALLEKEMALDTETTSLSVIDAHLVGISICFQPNEAFYIPLTHRIGANIDDPQEAVEIVKRMAYKASRVHFFNYTYDIEILRAAQRGPLVLGFDPWKISHLDVQTLVWNVDTNVKFPSLKASALHHLGIKMLTYEETAANVIDFSYVDPEAARVYAAPDAWCTYLLRQRFKEFQERIKFIFEIDNELERVMLFLTDTPLPIDRDRAQLMVTKTQNQITALEHEIHQLAGTAFDINSPTQFRNVIVGMGCPLSATTPTGLASTRELDLKPLEHDYPIIAKVLEYRSLTKLFGSYLQPFANHPTESVLIQYHLKAAPTGRFASGGDSKKNKGTKKFFAFNIQSTVKPDPGYFTFAPDASGATDTVLGYRFTPCSQDTPDCLEGYLDNNVRQIFKSYPGHYLVSIDYDGEELRIAANLGDEAYKKAYLAGEDPHENTARQMFPTYDKALRKIAKNCNFGLQYGGNEYTLHQRLPDKTMEECQEFTAIWKKLHRSWISYCQKCCDYARKTGFITTQLGRVRRVGTYYKSPNRRDWAFADRTIANTQVQGLAADIMRMVTVRLFIEVFNNPAYKGLIHFMATLHDEIDISITRDPVMFTEIVQRIMKIMTEIPLDWEVPLTVSPSVGTSWGSIFPFSLKSGVWVPGAA